MKEKGKLFCDVCGREVTSHIAHHSRIFCGESCWMFFEAFHADEDKEVQETFTFMVGNE